MKRTPIRRVSTKRAKQLREYFVIRENYLAEHRLCNVCKSSKATDIHHLRGRVGTRLNDTQYFMAVCRSCHDEIHHNPRWAYENGLLLTK
jgi:hypothetical protein